MKTQMINVLKMPSKRTNDSTGSNGNARYEEGTSSVKKVCVVNEGCMASIQPVEVVLGSAICEGEGVGLLERMISSIESKASRPELPSIPLLRFWSA